MTEKKILQSIHFPFIVNLNYHFQVKVSKMRLYHVNYIIQNMNRMIRIFT